jgi:protein-S-isoprenylcysteine O-methyltransferase Ste14
MRISGFEPARDVKFERQPRKAIRALGLWLLDHENRIFGIILALAAIRSWSSLYARLDEYFIYISNGIYAAPLLSLITIAFSALYVSASSAILLAATKPVARYEMLLPNLLAVLAGFGVYVFGLLTPAETRPFGLILPLALLVIGAAIVLLALIYLRRAFSVTPQARTVVQNGPYAVVRHPMYIGNILSITGWGLVIGTPQALVLSLGACALQICRAYYEDHLLVATFPEYREYMTKVNAFIPRFDFGRRVRLLLLVFAVTGAAFLFRNAPVRADPNIGAKCQAWHQKALSGEWFTKREGEDFIEISVERQEEIVQSVPACRAFFRLQKTCEDAFNEPGLYQANRTHPSAVEVKRLENELLRTLESVAGCKSIIGLELACGTVREAARRGNLSPRLQSILQECSNESIVNRTSSMIRPVV